MKQCECGKTMFPMKIHAGYASLPTSALVCTCGNIIEKRKKK